MLATRSVGKRNELAALFAAAKITVASLDDMGIAEDAAEDALEVHETFEENARAKARWFAARLPGHAVIADDSGLVVDALNGAPGVRSKRWSGSTESGAALEATNNAALLLALSHALSHARSHTLGESADDSDSDSDDARRARYVCSVVCVRGEKEWVARGTCEGRILHAARGDGGFGYDPLFWSDDLQRAFGECTREEKAAVSHRGRAMRALLALLALLVPRAQRA